MSNEIVFINGKSRCGCMMAFSDGGGEYSDVHRITLCEQHQVSDISQPHESRKFDQAKLINKFYERYPLDTFKSDSERAEALGYYMAGAELQRCGEFIVYEDADCDE